MALDGDKLRNLRSIKGMSQEKLAILAGVNKRTIQRAENGEAVGLETAAFIAEALEVSLTSLRGVQINNLAEEKTEWNEVALIPVNSGRRIIDSLRNCFEASITFDVEPTHENIEVLGQVASMLERFNPNPWGDPFESYAPDLAEVLQKQADLNALLPKLQELGINIFLGTYQASRQMPSYSEEGFMYVRSNTPYEAATVVLINVSDTLSSHLLLKPDDVYSYGYSQGNMDEEIPF